MEGLGDALHVTLSHLVAVNECLIEIRAFEAAVEDVWRAIPIVGEGGQGCADERIAEICLPLSVDNQEESD